MKNYKKLLFILYFVLLHLRLRTAMARKFQPFVAEVISKKNREEARLRQEEEARQRQKEEARQRQEFQEQKTNRILTEIAARIAKKKLLNAPNPCVNSFVPAPQPAPNPMSSTLNPDANSFVPAPPREQEQEPELVVPSTLNPLVKPFVPKM